MAHTEQKASVAAEVAHAAPKVGVRRDTIVDKLQGVDVPDPYRWLEDVKSPEVQAWMKTEDETARAALATFPGRDQLAKRFRELFYVDSISAPVVRGGRFFYTRTHADKEKAIVYWKENEAAAEKVLLDPNGWSTDGTASLGVWTPSWDGRKVVYGKRENGEDEATLHVLDVDSGKSSDIDVIPGGKYADPSWTPDSAAFYYEFLTTDPSIPVSERPGYTEIRYHKLGSDPKADPLVHSKTGDPSTFLAQSLSRDGRYLFVYVQRGWNENDIWMKDLKKDKEFHKLVEGKDATYGVTVWDGNLYIVTDEGAPKKRLFRTPAAKPDRKDWKEIVPEDATGTLETFSIVGGRLALSYLRDASSHLRTTALDGTDGRDVALSGIGTSHGVVGEPDQDAAYFVFSSFTVPMQVHKLAVAKNSASLWAEVKLPVDATQFEVEQVFFTSKDGTRVPMFLVHRKGLAKDGNNPTLLYGYGGFDVSLTPNFRGSIYPWIEAGGVYAVANLRGGGEYGKAWHDAGKGAKKQNVFDDFAAAAQFLVHEGWTKPARLGINGGSNGGLLMGAAMTQHPELYGAVVCQVPLLDMLRFHLFGSGKTWVPEYGSAENADEFKTLAAYSPYNNVKDGTRYPPLLMMSADHDDRVDPLHARKFVARVEQAEESLKDPPLTLLRIERHSGHGGADQVKQAIEMSADMYAFLFHVLGVKPQ
jgi:prolyl oligopeptidase